MFKVQSWGRIDTNCCLHIVIAGNVLYDFFIGRELNPRLGPLDLKFFCELRPGLIGWVILDLSFVMKAYESGGVVPPALALVTVFHTWYVADALWFEVSENKSHLFNVNLFNFKEYFVHAFN